MDSLVPLAAYPSAWAALATLVVMEVVRGIDNLIFIAIRTNKLPAERQEAARRTGIGLALILRLALLGTVAWIVHLTEPVLDAFDHGFSWRDLILIAGGLFLLWKATKRSITASAPTAGRRRKVGRRSASPRRSARPWYSTSCSRSTRSSRQSA